MNEAEGANLQIFRLQQIKKVADNINSLRNEREMHKKRFEESANNM